MTKVNWQNDFIEIIALFDYSASKPDYQIIKGKTYYAYVKDYVNYDIIDIYLAPFDDDDEYGHFAGIAFFCGKHHKSNFTTLAEWREKQINSILDD